MKLPRLLPYLHFILLITVRGYAQQFKTVPAGLFSGPEPFVFNGVLCTTKGAVLLPNSTGISEIDGMNIEIVTSKPLLTDSKGNKTFLGRNSNIFKDQYDRATGVKLLCEGPGNIVYAVTDNNNFGVVDYSINRAILPAPFNLPLIGGRKANITKIWMDGTGALFAATGTDTMFMVANAASLYRTDSGKKQALTYTAGFDKDSNLVITVNPLPVRKISLYSGVVPCSFAQGSDDARILLVGTNNGVYGYDKQTGQSIDYTSVANVDKFTVTGLEENKIGSAIWFSTLEKGLGNFDLMTRQTTFYPYPVKSPGKNRLYPVKGFSHKNQNELFVAIADSLPAIFNIQSGEYTFINDTLFHRTADKTTDVQADAFGNLFVIKGGGLYWSRNWMQHNAGAFAGDSNLYGPFISNISIGGKWYNQEQQFFGRLETLKAISLQYNENDIEIHYSCRGINPDSLVYAWKMESYSNGWTTVPFSFLSDALNSVRFTGLKPGNYIFRLRARSGQDNWISKEAALKISIRSPYWQQWWFWVLLTGGGFAAVYALVKWRVSKVRKQEHIKASHEKELLELEARALRAQMNPHFIFNCLNSIKSLIQQGNDEKAITYLTTFSKLIRTLFNNADKKQITLYDEIETCKLYLKLESMRFDTKFSYQVAIDENIDLKSVYVPALIIQPFLENAIWHGIIPGNTGGAVALKVTRGTDAIRIIIEDNGIGRDASRLNKPGNEQAHQSKGVNLTQFRLQLNNLLQQRQAMLEIIDMKDENNSARGTRIVITLKDEL